MSTVSEPDRVKRADASQQGDTADAVASQRARDCAGRIVSSILAKAPFFSAALATFR